MSHSKFIYKTNAISWKKSTGKDRALEFCSSEAFHIRARACVHTNQKTQ